MPSFTCVASGITAVHGGVLRLNMRATSGGGTTQGAVVQVTVDAQPPTGSVKINNGASATRLPTVTLVFTATDGSGVAAMCISNAPSCTTWLTFAQAKTWTLSSGDGLKVVYVWFRDRVGNVSAAPIQGQIILDTTAPANPTTVTSSDHAVSSWSTDRTVTIQWSGAADAGSGVSGYSLRWDRLPSTIPDAVADTTAATATSSGLTDGNNHYVHLRTVDKAANWSASAVHLAANWCTNGTSISVGAAAQFEHQNLVPGTRYYYRLCAVDKAGNVSTGAVATTIAK